MEPSLQALFDSAVKRFEEGDWQAARSNCEQILAQSPNEALAALLLGLCYAREGRLQSAEESVRFALALHPLLPKGQKRLAEIMEAREAMRAQPYSRKYMLSRFRYRDYPRNVGIETTGRCNATCNFCPNPKLDRKSTAMNDALFDKIIKDLREIPQDHPSNIFPNEVNEPFMDRKIFDRLEKINAELPQASLHIFTNLNVMQRDFFERMAKIRKIVAFNVSFNAARCEEYEQVMGIDFDRTVKNLRSFMTVNRTHKIVRGPIVLSRVADHTSTDDAFIGDCQKLFAEFTYGEDYTAKAKNRTDWLGQVSAASSPIPHALPCGSWFDIHIFCTGVVPHCCMDSYGEYSIGDVNKSSVLEVYNSPGFRRYRDQFFSREQAHPCNTCSLLQ